MLLIVLKGIPLFWYNSCSIVTDVSFPLCLNFNHGIYLFTSSCRLICPLCSKFKIPKAVKALLLDDNSNKVSELTGFFSSVSEYPNPL